MAMMACLLLTSCGTKPAVIQMAEITETPAPTPVIDIVGEPAIASNQATSPVKIFVHVCGAVNQPGVYEMLEGSRVFEAVELAAGFTEEAHQQSVNLADKVLDGQQIVVPTTEEAAMMPKVEAVSGMPSEQNLININTASAATLQELNGIGEAKAKEILSHREKNGAFNSIEDIKNVSGIGEKLYEKIKENITVD